MQYYHNNGEFDLDRSTLLAGGYGFTLGAFSPYTPLDELEKIKPITPTGQFARPTSSVSSVSASGMPGVNTDVVLKNIFGPPTWRNWLRELILMGAGQLDAEEILLD